MRAPPRRLTVSVYDAGLAAAVGWYHHLSVWPSTSYRPPETLTSRSSSNGGKIAVVVCWCCRCCCWPWAIAVTVAVSPDHVESARFSTVTVSTLRAALVTLDAGEPDRDEVDEPASAGRGRAPDFASPLKTTGGAAGSAANLSTEA